MNKITKGYVNRFDLIKFTQILPSGRRVCETYFKQPNVEEWTIQYTTDSAYHICPYDGIFRDCGNCDVYEEAGDEEDFIERCLAHIQRINSMELARRCTLCERDENCDVYYWSNF